MKSTFPLQIASHAPFIFPLQRLELEAILFLCPHKEACQSAFPPPA